MNGNTLDKLFQKKLGGLEANPAEDAWNQINEALQSSRRKNYSKLYLSLAAVITLMVTVSISWIQMNKETIPTISQEIPDEVITDNTIGSMNLIAATEPESPTTENKNILNINILNESSITARSKINLINLEQKKPDNLLPDLNNSTAVVISIYPSSASVHVNLSGMDLDFYPMFSPIAAPQVDDSKFSRAFKYALSVKNGEENLFDLKKAKQNLFTFAKQKLKTEEHSQINFD